MEECVGETHRPDVADAQTQSGGGAVLACIHGSQEEEDYGVDHHDKLPSPARAEALAELAAYPQNTRRQHHEKEKGDGPRPADSVDSLPGKRLEVLPADHLVSLALPHGRFLKSVEHSR